MTNSTEVGLTKFTKKILKKNADVIPIRAFGPLMSEARSEHFAKLAKDSFSEKKDG